jgi:hypothetical protein
VLSALREAGEEPIVVGHIEAGEPSVRYERLP